MPAIRHADPSSRASRAVSLLLVALLHALLLFAFLNHMVVTPKSATAKVPERLLEMIINTAPKPAPLIKPAPRVRSLPSRPSRGGVTSGAMPSYAPPVAPPDITGLGQALFGCAPENLTNLTQEQRAHCTGGITRPEDDALAQPKSHVKDPVRREAEMRAKNTPGRVPCTYFTNAQTPYGNKPVPMVDPICALDGLINGFRPLSGLDK